MGSYESVHNDTDQTVIVWWQLLGGGQPVDPQDPQGGAINSYYSGILHPGATTAQKGISLSLVHQVCVMYEAPNSHWRSWSSSCKEAWSPSLTGQVAAYRVSDIIHNQCDSTCCSASDQTAINALVGGDDDGSFPKTNLDCAKSAISILTGINKDKFNTCLTGKVSISKGCSMCFAEATQYGYQNCKFQCLSNAFSDSCLECSAGFDVTECTGFDPPQPSPQQQQQLNIEILQHTQVSPQGISIPAVAAIGLFVGGGVALALRSFRSKARNCLT